MNFTLSMLRAWDVRFVWTLMSSFTSNHLMEQTMKLILAMLHHQKNCVETCAKKRDAFSSSQGLIKFAPNPKLDQTHAKKRKFKRDFMDINLLLPTRISALSVIADWRKDG